MPFFKKYENDFRNYTNFPDHISSTPHVHPHFEALLVLQPCVQAITVNGIRHLITEPSLSIYSPFTMHSVEPDPQAKEQCYTCFFDNSMLTDYQGGFASFRSYQQYEFVYRTIPAALAEELTAMISRHKIVTKDVITRKLIFLMIMNKLIHKGAKEQIHCEMLPHGNFIKIIRYMSEHYEQDLTAESVANHFSISRASLNLSFKKYTTTSFHQLLMEIRLHQATAMLLGGEINVKDVANKVGFDSETHFYACFKKRKGISPRKFAKNNQRS